VKSVLETSARPKEGPMPTATKPTFRSPNVLPEEFRRRVADSLNESLLDGIDLATQLKVAHWNIKGPHFASLHPLLDTIAGDVVARNDEIAERAVALGYLAGGTARQVAAKSRLSELPAEATRDLELIGLVADRLEGHLNGLRKAQAVADEVGDAETVDLLTQAISQFEKHGWFLRATLEK
jgi:starvation-inducible DNA-binding protein